LTKEKKETLVGALFKFSRINSSGFPFILFFYDAIPLILQFFLNVHGNKKRKQKKNRELLNEKNKKNKIQQTVGKEPRR
jgi:hypothetical protein